MRPTHIDLFSGIGGFSIAAERSGFETIGFSEIDPYASAVLSKHWPGVPNYGDIRNVRGIPCDLITGGFPCQPFSCAGKRRGTADDRHLWPEMLRVIAEARPAWVLGENVAGIINMELDTVLSDLEGIGYATRTFVIPACGVDARHRRNRVWIVAHSEHRGSQERRAGCDASVERSGCGGQTPSRNIPTTQKSSAVPNSDEPGSQGRNGKELCERAGERASRTNCSSHADANGQSSRRSAIARRECCEWLPEPEFCRVVDGLPEELDGGIDASQRLDFEVTSFAGLEVRLRELWGQIANRDSSSRQRSFQQLAIELGDALCGVPHEGALERRQEALAQAFGYLRNLRQACEAIGAMRNPSNTLAAVWRSMSRAEADWTHMAACAGLFHSEWPDVPRVATGVKNRVDRLRGLGNAIVPQVAEVILRAIHNLICHE